MKTEIEKILHRHHANQLSTDNAINEVLRLFDISGNEGLQKSKIKKETEVAVCDHPIEKRTWNEYYDRSECICGELI